MDAKTINGRCDEETLIHKIKEHVGHLIESDTLGKTQKRYVKLIAAGADILENQVGSPSTNP